MSNADDDFDEEDDAPIAAMRQSKRTQPQKPQKPQKQQKQQKQQKKQGQVQPKPKPKPKQKKLTATKTTRSMHKQQDASESDEFEFSTAAASPNEPADAFDFAASSTALAPDPPPNAIAPKIAPGSSAKKPRRRRPLSKSVTSKKPKPQNRAAKKKTGKPPKKVQGRPQKQPRPAQTSEDEEDEEDSFAIQTGEKISSASSKASTSPLASTNAAASRPRRTARGVNYAEAASSQQTQPTQMSDDESDPIIKAKQSTPPPSRPRLVAPISTSDGETSDVPSPVQQMEDNHDFDEDEDVTSPLSQDMSLATKRVRELRQPHASMQDNDISDADFPPINSAQMPPLSVTEFECMTVEKLKKELQRRHLPITTDKKKAPKAQLRARLEPFVARNDTTNEAAADADARGTIKSMSVPAVSLTAASFSTPMQSFGQDEMANDSDEGTENSSFEALILQLRASQREPLMSGTPSTAAADKDNACNDSEMQDYDPLYGQLGHHVQEASPSALSIAGNGASDSDDDDDDVHERQFGTSYPKELGALVNRWRADYSKESLQREKQNETKAFSALHEDVEARFVALESKKRAREDDLESKLARVASELAANFKADKVKVEKIQGEIDTLMKKAAGEVIKASTLADAARDLEPRIIEQGKHLIAKMELMAAKRLRVMEKKTKQSGNFMETVKQVLQSNDDDFM
jgi:hypothetical protein